MKRLTLFLIACFCFTTAFSQVGVYESHEAFLDKKLKTYAEYVGTKSKNGRYAILLKDTEGGKVILPLSEQNIWGYQKEEDKIVRVHQNKTPYLIYKQGRITLYFNYHSNVGSEEALSSSKVKDALYSEDFPPQISLGTDGEMVRLSKKNLGILLEDDQDAMAKLEKHSIFYESLVEFILTYNESVEVSTL
ncbi:hypothetical protein [Sediminitomix flava]|uniref:Uncharacterized protein n=1 Tax=Sediminitomix flava TaxID=379075 RepID=A0A315Z9L0_SEDFL|nr:hypothetical protein [Sediminitomix flava]PWJ40884.1 hypothetical protein BC781_104144 [Sediminitomix flava]